MACGKDNKMQRFLVASWALFLELSPRAVEAQEMQVEIAQPPVEPSFQIPGR
jgi:hypothetical protein